MKFTSFNFITFASLNVTASLPNDTPDGDRAPNVIERLNKTGFVSGMRLGVRTIPVYFMVKPGFDTEQTILALIAALDPDNPEPRPLHGQLNDGSTTVMMMARPGQYIARPGDTKGLLVPFISDEPRWRTTADSTIGPTSFPVAGTSVLSIGGNGRVNPTIKVGWSSQRTVFISDLGWKYIRPITITNNTEQSWHKQVIQLGPFNTATLIAASKMLVTGSDWAIFDERGVRQRALVYAMDSRASFITFVLDELVAGGSRTFDMAYGNPSAASYGFTTASGDAPTIDVTAIDGTATAGTTTSLTTGVTVDPNRFNSGTIILTKSGIANAGQYRRVQSHTTAGVYTPTRAFTTAPGATTRYAVVSGPFMGDGGQASSSSATTLTDSSQSWNAKEWIGGDVEIITLDTDMGAVVQTAPITANTATSVTVASWPSGTPSATAIYRVSKRNGNYIYRVDQTDRNQTRARGRWLLNRFKTKPSGVWFAADGAPHAWTPTIYNPDNAHNNFSQLRVTPADIGGGDMDYFALLYARIARKDGKRFPALGFSNGVQLSVPLGILGIRQDYKFKNPSGMARAVFACRERGGEDWEPYKEDISTNATLTVKPTTYYDLTIYGTPLHLIAAITSDDDADIEKEQTDWAHLMDNTVLEVRVDTRGMSITDPATVTEINVYDMTLVIRRSTNASETAGDDLVRIGRGGHHLFIPNGYLLWVGKINESPLACRIYNGSTFWRDVPWQVEVYHVATDYLGNDIRFYSADVLPLQPGSNTLRVADPDGGSATMGTVTVTTVYRPTYL